MRSFGLIGAAAAAGAALHVHPIGAQSVVQMLSNDVRNSAVDVWSVWTSPFRATSSDWVGTAGVFALTAAVSPADAGVDRWAAHNQNASVFKFLKPIREGGAVFSGPTITPIALGALAVGLVTKNQTLQEGIWGCASAYAASSVVRTFVLYPLVARTRPDSGRSGNAPPASQGDQYDFSFPGSTKWGEHSFPGGHMANVAACTGFLTQRFSMGIAEPIPWIVTGGIAVGREVAVRSLHRHEKEKQKKEQTAAGERVGQLFLAPTANGVQLGWQRVF